MVDDASTDNSYSIASTITQNDERFFLLSNSLAATGPAGHAHGPAAARNLAINSAKSPLLAFCDVDDFWHPSKLELQLKFHIENNLDISVTSFSRFSDTPPLPTISPLITPPRQTNYKQLLASNSLPLLTVIVRASLVSSGFPYCFHEDYALWLMVFFRHPSIRYGCLPILLSFYRVHSSNLTRNKALMPFWVYSAYRKHGLSIFQSLCTLPFWMCLQASRLLILNKPQNISLTVSQLMDLSPQRLPRAEWSSL